MEGYYSSDDDIAWGPYSRREAKRDIRKGLPSKPYRRHTYPGYLYAKDNNNTWFLQKRLENKEISNELNNSMLYILEKPSSDLFKPNENGPSTADEKIIDICSNSRITKVQLDINTSLCKEESDSDEQHYKNLNKCNLRNSKVRDSHLNNNPNNDDEHILCGTLDNMNEIPDIENITKRLSNDLHIKYHVSSSSDVTNIDVIKDTICKNQYVPELLIGSYKNRESSHIFNDTLEEIDMVLKYGLDYKMPVNMEHTHSRQTAGCNTGGSKGIENHITNSPLTHICSKSYGTPKRPAATSCIPIQKNKSKIIADTIVGIKKQPEAQSSRNFKVPCRSSKQKVTPNKSLVSHSNKFKDIISPVGIYIKQSPAHFIKRSILPTDSPNKLAKKTPEAMPLKNIENTSLPQVVYKPAKKKIVFEKKDVVLSKSIRKLICEAEITKNEGRITRKVKDTSAGTQLEIYEQDLTSIDENTLDMTGDVSILTKKQGFIK